MERHTSQDSQRWIVALKGTRLPVGDLLDGESHLALPAERHDYTYGASKKSLRPLIEDEEPDSCVPGSKPGKKRGPYKRRTRPVAARVVQPVVERRERYPVAEPVVYAPSFRKRDTPYPRRDPRLTMDDLLEILSES